MKKQFLFATLALATLFTACSKEEELSKNEGTTPVNFVIGGIGARTVTDASYVATFEEYDEVGIFSTGLSETQMENVKYTVNTAKTGLDATEQTEYVFGVGNATFYAYYPWATGLTSSTVGLTIKTDQNITGDTDNFNCNDLLIATATGSSESTDGVALDFDHVMSFVEVSFGTNLSTIGVSSVTMKVQPTIAYNFTFTEDTKYTVSGNATDITMYKNGEKFWAIVPPQTISAGTALFTITADNSRTYTYTVADNTTETFASNAIRKIKLDIASEEEPSTATVFMIASIDINGWGNVNNVEEENKDVVMSGINFITLGTSANLNLDLFTSNDTWGVSGATAEYDATNDAVKVIGGSGTYWNNNALFYCYQKDITIDQNKTYTLSFDIKTDSNNTENSVQYFIAHSSTFFYYLVDNAESGVNTANPINNSSFSSEEFKTITCNTINLSKGAASANQKQTAVDNPNATGNIIIGFRLAKANQTYYIKNITFTENIQATE